MNEKTQDSSRVWESDLGVRPIPAEFEDIKFTRSGQVDRRIKPERQQAFAAWVTGGGETGNILRDAHHRAHAKPASATPSADSAESFCIQCRGLGYYDEGHENADGTMSGGNYVECEKCRPSATDDNTESMLIDAMRSTMAAAWGYLWHITTADNRVNGARAMLCDMLRASGLTPAEFHEMKRYGIQQAKQDGCEVEPREFLWGEHY